MVCEEGRSRKCVFSFSQASTSLGRDHPCAPLFCRWGDVVGQLTGARECCASFPAPGFAVTRPCIPVASFFSRLSSLLPPSSFPFINPSSTDKTLQTLLNAQHAKVDDIKKKTNFYETYDLLSRYGGSFSGLPSPSGAGNANGGGEGGESVSMPNAPQRTGQVQRGGTTSSLPYLFYWLFERVAGEGPLYGERCVCAGRQRAGECC